MQAPDSSSSIEQTESSGKERQIQYYRFDENTAKCKEAHAAHCEKLPVAQATFIFWGEKVKKLRQKQLNDPVKLD
ncbi:hypothetical protein DPV78_000600 [Talaromyces pinophilus]|nr:hypothetical protein DPV78_000600 [Talaromyces pinophilus]